MFPYRFSREKKLKEFVFVDLVDTLASLESLNTIAMYFNRYKYLSIPLGKAKIQRRTSIKNALTLYSL